MTTEEAKTEDTTDGALLPLDHSDLLEEIVRALVADQAAVHIADEYNDGTLRLRIGVAPNDRGRIIGKQGSMISLLRQLFTRIGATDNQLRIMVDLAQDADEKRFRVRKARAKRQ